MGEASEGVEEGVAVNATAIRLVLSFAWVLLPLSAEDVIKQFGEHELDRKPSFM